MVELSLLFMFSYILEYSSIEILLLINLTSSVTTSSTYAKTLTTVYVRKCFEYVSVSFLNLQLQTFSKLWLWSNWKDRFTVIILTGLVTQLLYLVENDFEVLLIFGAL